MSEWIAVKDRLPECIEAVLSYSENRPEGLRYGIWRKIQKDEDDNAYYWITYGEVSHWKPLVPPSE